MDIIQMTPKRLEEMLTRSAQLGAMNALLNAGIPVRDLFTREEMYRMHGRLIVDKAIKDGRLTGVRNDDKSRVRYSEQQFLTIF